MAAISTKYLNEVVYPKLWDEIGSLFPEMGFKLVRGKWISPKKLDGSDPKEPTRNKTQVRPENPSYAFESGEAPVSLIDLYQNHNNKTYWEALEDFCKKVNVPLPTTKSEEERKAEKEIADQRAISFSRQQIALLKHEEPGALAVWEYLIKVRGYSEELIKDMWLGYISPDEAKILEERGKVGIACNIADFPLSIPYLSGGQIMGFCFRYISEEAKAKYGKHKYDKTRSLKGMEGENPFGLLSNTLNKGTNRKAGVILVEGELDALHAIAVGVENVIATSGGKIEPETVEVLKKKGYKEINIILDTDGKGQDFTRESIEVIHQAGLNSYVVTLPEGKDLDEYLVKHSVEELKELINKANHGSLYLFWKEAEAFLKTEQTDKDTDNFLTNVIDIASREIDPLKSSQILQTLKDKVLDQMGVNLDEIKKGIELKVAQRRREEENKRLTAATEAELKKASALLTEGKPAEAAAKVRKAEDILQNVEDREKYAKLLQDNTDELYESYKVAPKSLSTNIQLYTRDRTAYPLIFPSGAISIIGAITGHGKSKLLQSIALDAIEQPEKGMILYLTYEESEGNVNIQFLNAYANIEVTKKNFSGNRGNLQTIREHLSNGLYKFFKKDRKVDERGRVLYDYTQIIPTFQKKEEEWKEIRKAGKIRLIKPEDNTLGLLKGIIGYAIENPPLGLPIRAVFVDYVQELYLEEKDKTYGRTDELKKIMVDIDILAQEANIPIIMGAQLNRDTKSIKHLFNQIISDSGWIERKASEILLIWSSKEKGTEEVTEKDLQELGAVRMTDKGLKTIELGKDGELYLKLTKSRNIPTNTTTVLEINGNTGRVKGNVDRARITAEEQTLDLPDEPESGQQNFIPLPEPNPDDQYPTRGRYGRDEDEEIEHPGAAPDGLPF